MEEQGFEPWRPLRAYRFSRPAQSTTLPLLRAQAGLLSASAGPVKTAGIWDCTCCTSTDRNAILVASPPSGGVTASPGSTKGRHDGFAPHVECAWKSCFGSSYLTDEGQS